MARPVCVASASYSSATLSFAERPMGIVEDVEAIYADNTLSPAAKAQNAAVAKAVAWRSAVLGVGVLPQTWTFTANGAAWSITIATITVNGGTITFTGTVTKDGVTLTRNADGTRLWPISIQNPPTLFDDPTGTYQRNGRTLKLDLIALARSIFAQTVAEATP